MKVLILAAGRGTRLGKYTKNLPKGMLKVFGKTIIKRQIDIYRRLGVKDISIIKGYKGEKINYKDVKYYENPLFTNTNMVYSLFCAKKELNEDLLISYSDIIFEPQIIQNVIEDKNDITVVVDTCWKNYWKKRYGSINKDKEGLKLDEYGKIMELGKTNEKIKNIDARYLGIIKLSKKGALIFKKSWRKLQKENDEKDSFKKIYMTEFLQKLITSGYPVCSLKIKKGWLEFDTNEDLEKVILWRKNRILSKYINIS